MACKVIFQTNRQNNHKRHNEGYDVSSLTGTLVRVRSGMRIDEKIFNKNIMPSFISQRSSISDTQKNCALLYSLMLEVKRVWAAVAA